MTSFILLNSIIHRLAQQGMNSQLDLRRLNQDNKLKDILEENDFMKVLKNDISFYLDCLFYNEPYYSKKMKMELITKNNLEWNSYYALALYCDNQYAYRNLPLMLKLLIEKLEITKYQYLTIEDITTKVYQTFDIKCSNDPNINQWVCEIDYKRLSDKYFKYDKIYNYNSSHPTNVEEFSVWAEHRTFDDEKITLTNTIYKDYAIWAAREYGDGYGFDVLSIDKNTQKEKLIEVKSGQYWGFILTENEVKVMKNCKYKNADYYIYKYTYNRNENFIYLTTYKYNPELDLIVDENNDYYDLVSFTDYDEKNNKVIKYNITKVEKEKIKEKTT